MPAALVLAALANIFLLFILDAAVGVQLFTTLWLGSLASWGVVGGVALFGAATRTMRALYRFGILGWSRPRWWFEVSSLAWTLFALSILATGLLISAAHVPALQRWADAVFSVARSAFMVSFCGFFAAAIVGYVTSVITGRRRCGNAYECVQIIFPSVGGLGLLAIACLHWPPQGAWPDGALLAVCGVGGVALLVGAMVPLSSHPRVKKPRWLRE